MLTRREFLTTVGCAFTGLIVPGVRWIAQATENKGAGAKIIEIHMRSDELGSQVWFDPIGVYVEPGQTVRWVVAENTHTTTAYHPKNSNHSLRIPRDAAPWDSGFLNPGELFEITLTVEGVYDYYCMPHEAAGMVGRIIVGKPTGPGTLPFDYYQGKPGTTSWISVPQEAQKAFPSIEQIMREKIVRHKPET